MKIIKKIALFPLVLIHKVITGALDIVATLIVATGLIVLGISYFIKSPKMSKEVIKQTVKKLMENGL